MIRYRRLPDSRLFALTPVDPRAFGELYRRYERRLLGYFCARTGNPELAADLTAEVFATLYERAGAYDPSRGGENAGGWIFTISHNILMSSLRRGAVAADARMRLGMIEPVALDDDALARVEELAGRESEVMSLLDTLPAEQRQALIARVLEDRSYTEIADELACSPLVVRKRVSRALGAMRARVEERK